MRNYTIRFGTNINHEYNYEQAKRLLITLFGETTSFSEPKYSRDYNAEPDDDNASVYLNFIAKAESPLSPSDLKKLLKKAEQTMGRTATRKALGIIDADFDIIT